MIRTGVHGATAGRPVGGRGSRLGPASILPIGLLLATGAAFLAPPSLFGQGADAGVLPTVEELAAWFGPEGDPERAGEALLQIVAARQGSAATPWIHLVSLVDRLRPETAPSAVRAVGLAEEGRISQAGATLVEAAGQGEPADRGPLLAFAALLLEDEDPIQAAALRVRVLNEAPEVLETPEIMLRHSRWLLSIEARREEGFGLLEELIIEWPNHPITPDARRLLLLERARSAERTSGGASAQRPASGPSNR